MNHPTIEILPPRMADDERLVGEITDLVNHVYASAEAGLWVDGASRTTTAEVREMIATGEIGFAEHPDDLDPILELLNDDRLGSCLEEAFRIGVEQAAGDDQATAATGDVKIDQLGSEGLGDSGAGVQLTGEITAAGVAVPFSFAFQGVQVDRALVGIFTSGVGSGEPTADRTALLQILVDGVSDQTA